MRTGTHQLRPLIADTLHQVKAYDLPSVCERYGLEPGDEQEAFVSKRQYVFVRLKGVPDDEVFRLAREVLKTYPSDILQAEVEKTDETCRLVSDLTRHHLAEALDRFPLSDRRPIVDLLGKHWPEIYNTASFHTPLDRSLAHDIERHLVKEDDWTNSEVLEQIGFLSCSQAKLFAFIEDILHPIHRSDEMQEKLVADLNPILKRTDTSLHGQERFPAIPSIRSSRQICPTPALLTT